VTDEELLNEANIRLAKAGDVIVALAAFLRSTAQVRTGPTTICMVAGAGEWERLLDTTDRVSR
jgi:hypothetical protein